MLTPAPTGGRGTRRQATSIQLVTGPHGGQLSGACFAHGAAAVCVRPPDFSRSWRSTQPAATRRAIGTSRPFFLLILSLILSAIPGPTLLATTPERRVPSEYEAKSALVISLIKFVDWPSGTFADRRSPMIVGVLGDGPAEVVERCLQGKFARERRLVVRKFRHARDLEPVHVLFVFSHASAELLDAQRALRPGHVLTITEVPGVGITDAVVNLVPAGASFGFAVNLDQADEAGLRISPNLLTLSREVRSTRIRRQG